MKHSPWLILFCLFAGCDNGDNSSAPPPPATAPQVKWGVEVSSIAPLSARRHTHLTVDSRGNVYWVQENEGGDDLAFAVNQSGVPEAIPQLTSRRMLDLLHQAGGSGNIQSLVVGPDDQLYVYFAGGKGRTILAALAQFDPRAKSLRLLADTNQIVADSGLGKSLELARGSLVASSTDLWLWLRHTDGYVMLRVLTSTSLARPSELKRPYEAAHVPPKAAKAPGMSVAPKPGDLKLISENEDLSAGANQKLFYVDRASGILWQIDGAGVASVSRSLQGWPELVTAPIIDNKGRLHLFVGESERINVLEAGDEDPQLVNLALPALLDFDSVRPSDKLTVIPRQDMKAMTNMPLTAIQASVWAMDPVAGGFVVYDAASGELLRMKVIRK